MTFTFDDVRARALAWPGGENGTSYGTPALKVRGKFPTRLREDGVPWSSPASTVTSAPC
ncbi:hypothetical protein [Nitrospirillum sp. BR 11163]|uniref:hypothetical protein n=1 Tax=Nitrospirillum sp. BR 11163 TaxID=3104323 RepID=UPI002AFEFE19|nr:hypothetical protein [Nitrospirillum sp. BR 11163]MEA1673950.1 hypothetical protein [Nitrospirillum sp. BR 11163]